MTLCRYRGIRNVKCKRRAEAAHRGKPYCNQHLQQLRTEEIAQIDFEKVEKDSI